jgi:hypothetical protein
MIRLAAVCGVAVLLAAGPAASPVAESARLRYLASAYADGAAVGLRLPEGVACGPDGQIVVGDTGNDRLLRFTYRDKVFTAGAEMRAPELSAPSRLHLGPNGEIYALDLTRRRVVELGPDGTFRRTLSVTGAPPPSTVVVKDFAVDAEGAIYVLDAFAARVLVLSAGAEFQRTLPLPEEAGFGSGLAVDAAGTIVLLDSTGRRVFAAPKPSAVFAPLGGRLDAILATMPASITVSRGLILLAEGPGSSIVGLSRDGSFVARQLTRGWREGALDQPSQLCVNDRDELFVADRDNSRVQVFQLTR